MSSISWRYVNTAESAGEKEAAEMIDVACGWLTVRSAGFDDLAVHRFADVRVVAGDDLHRARDVAREDGLES